MSGDTTRGAYWWCGGYDRILIDCETGLVRIAVALDTPVIRSNILKGLSTTTPRIEDNVAITGNATFNGLIKGNIEATSAKVSETSPITARQTIVLRGNSQVYGSLGATGNIVSTGDLVITGSLTATNSNPFWIAGKVAADGVPYNSVGRHSFTSSKISTGQYAILPSTQKPFPNSHYIVQLTCQVDAANATVHLVNFGLSTTRFQLIIRLDGIAADCVFQFSVIA